MPACHPACSCARAQRLHPDRWPGHGTPLHRHPVPSRRGRVASSHEQADSPQSGGAEPNGGNRAVLGGDQPLCSRGDCLHPEPSDTFASDLSLTPGLMRACRGGGPGPLLLTPIILLSPGSRGQKRGDARGPAMRVTTWSACVSISAVRVHQGIRGLGFLCAKETRSQDQRGVWRMNFNVKSFNLV